MIRIVVTTVFVSCVLAGSAAGASVVLKPGDAVLVRGTDLACADGGPANHLGVECVHTSTAGSLDAWTFRLEEDTLVAFHVQAGTQVASKSWREPRTLPERHAPAVNNANHLVAHPAVGAQFAATATDLGCVVSRVSGQVGVVCAKRRAGKPIVGSIEVVMTHTLRVERVGAHGATTIFVGS